MKTLKEIKSSIFKFLKDEPRSRDELTEHFIVHLHCEYTTFNADINKLISEDKIITKNNNIFSLNKKR